MANIPERTPVTLFADDRLAPRQKRPRARRIGWMLLALALAGTLLLGMTPSPYVIEQPGPVFDTIGEVTIGGKQVPLIDISGTTVYPTSGSLDMLTVNLVGNRAALPNWLEVVRALLDPSRAVVPLDSVYPPGRTVEQSDSQSSVDMANSQRDAIAAALTKLGYVLPVSLSVGGLTPESPSEGVVKKGDVILGINGQIATSVAEVRAIVAEGAPGEPVTLQIRRDGVEQTVQVTPQLSSDKPPVPLIGIYPAISYVFPFEVKIQVGDVGGPSAGQMLALGIIDKLTTGELNGGKKVAGTGTIDIAGDVGAIGGIRQKLYGARDAGAKWFLAPASNCDEVTGHIPAGIRVLAVKNLDDSLAALRAIAAGSGTAALPHCAAG